MNEPVAFACHPFAAVGGYFLNHADVVSNVPPNVLYTQFVIRRHLSYGFFKFKPIRNVVLWLSWRISHATTTTYFLDSTEKT
jgi:hypothetical protein